MFAGIYFCNFKGGRENRLINPSQTLLNLQYLLLKFWPPLFNIYTSTNLPDVLDVCLSVMVRGLVTVVIIKTNIYTYC